MEIELSKLKPNPFRDFTVDPIDPENVKTLIASIKQDGFWGGIVCRRVNGDIQIGAGHHRIEAARKAGIKKADLFIGELDDAAMIRVYARENASQRGNSATATAGSVASAIKFLARAILIGDEHIWRNLQMSPKAVDSARGNLASDKGLGLELIEKFLESVPRITAWTIRQQLASLKKSGDYARIITEVTQQIEAERKEAVAELERLQRERRAADAEAEKRKLELALAKRRAKESKEKADRKAAEEIQKQAEADALLADKRRAEFDAELKKFDALRISHEATTQAAEQVAKYEVEFDFAGVAKYLKNENQVQAFRTEALKPGVKVYLPVTKQSLLAEHLVELAKKSPEAHERAQMSAEFIKDNIWIALQNAKLYERELKREERADLEAQDIRNKFDRLQDDFLRGLRVMVQAGMEMVELMAKHRTTTFHITNETRSVLATAQSVITKLVNKI